MSKFDKYGGNIPLLPSGSFREASSSYVASALAKIAEKSENASDRANELLHGRPAKVAIALDATGSMAGLISSAKAHIAEIIKRASQEAQQPVEIELFAYRDYDVPQNLIARSGLHSEAEKLVHWLHNVDAMGGGGNQGEAVEAALDLILRDGSFSVVLLAGDEPSNSSASLTAAGRRNALSAGTLAGKLGASKIPIYSFVVGSDPRTIADFARLSELSGGKSGRLDGSKEMIDLAVMAILVRLKGTKDVQRYASQSQLSSNSKAFAHLLLGGK